MSVEPDPRNGSTTMSPGSVSASMYAVSSATGNGGAPGDRANDSLALAAERERSRSVCVSARQAAGSFDYAVAFATRVVGD